MLLQTQARPKALVTEGALSYGVDFSERVAYTEYRLPRGVPKFGHVLLMQGLKSNRNSKGAIRAAQILNSCGFDATIMDVFAHSDPNSQFRSSGTWGELTVSRALGGYHRMMKHIAGLRPETLHVLSNSFSTLIAKAGVLDVNGKRPVLPHAIAGRSAATYYKEIVDSHFGKVPEIMEAWRNTGVLNAPGFPQVGIEFYNELQSFSPEVLSAALRKARVFYVGVHSKDDEQVPWSHADRFCRDTPNSALFTLHGVGHSLEKKFDDSVMTAARTFVLEWGKQRELTPEQTVREEKGRAEYFPDLPQLAA